LQTTYMVLVTPVRLDVADNLPFRMKNTSVVIVGSLD